MVILEDNFKWHLEAFASELFIYIYLWDCMTPDVSCDLSCFLKIIHTVKGVHKSGCFSKMMQIVCNYIASSYHKFLFSILWKSKTHT